MEKLIMIGIILGVAGLQYLIWCHGYQAGQRNTLDEIDMFAARYQAKLDAQVEAIKGESK